MVYTSCTVSSLHEYAIIKAGTSTPDIERDQEDGWIRASKRKTLVKLLGASEDVGNVAEDPSLYVHQKTCWHGQLWQVCVDLIIL